MRQVGLPGYPEGHPRIATATLAAALAEKLALARGQGLGAYVVTQFSFAPNRIVEYCVDLARRAADVPVYVGLAGPTSPVTLLRYAQRCGVSASLRALQAQGMGAVRLFTHVDPADQLAALARHARSGSASNVVGVHLYSFGGVAATAAWMNARITARGIECALSSRNSRQRISGTQPVHPSPAKGGDGRTYPRLSGLRAVSSRAAPGSGSSGACASPSGPRTRGASSGSAVPYCAFCTSAPVPTSTILVCGMAGAAVAPMGANTAAIATTPAASVSFVNIFPSSLVAPRGHPSTPGRPSGPSQSPVA